MAERSSPTVGDVLNTREQQEDEARTCPTAVSGRRPLSDSGVKYKEDVFQDSSDVILVNFTARRNSLSTPGSSDGDTSDDVDGEGTADSIAYLPSLAEPVNSFPARVKKATKSSFVCDCQQSQKAKRKAASKLASVSSAGFALPGVSSLNGTDGGNRRSKDTSFMNRVKKWFGDSDSPTHFENVEPGWPNSSGVRLKTKGSAPPFLRSSKKELQKKEQQYLICDILAVTNCPYYWGKINRHEAEELLLGKPDGTFLLRDSAHKEHLFSVSFCRYNKTLHARVEQWDHKYSFDRESVTAYYSKTIKGLLSHYSVGEYCMFFEPMLVKPLHRKEPQPLMSLCRAAIGNCTTYQDVEKLPIPSALKTFLKEYNYCIRPKSKKDELDGKRKRNSTLCIF